MTRRWVRPLALTVLLAALMAVRLHAILGLGDIVFDPTSFAKLTQQLVQMEQQYVQLVESYRVLRTQYEHAVKMARRLPVNMAARYGIAPAPWSALSAADTFGTTTPWVNALNSGVAAAEAYSRTIERLDTYAAQRGESPSDYARSIYGSVEMADGANVYALQAIGQTRRRAAAHEAALARLQEDAYSTSPEMNTQIAVLNKINAAGVANAVAVRDTNQLLVTLAEQEVLRARRTREAEARAINQHIAFTSHGHSRAAALAAGTTEALRTWRLR